VMDLTGIDICYFVNEYFHKELNKELKWVSPNLLKTMIRAGKLGRKTGEGWYDTANNTQMSHQPYFEASLKYGYMRSKPNKRRQFRSNCLLLLSEKRA